MIIMIKKRGQIFQKRGECPYEVIDRTPEKFVQVSKLTLSQIGSHQPFFSNTSHQQLHHICGINNLIKVHTYLSDSY